MSLYNAPCAPYHDDVRTASAAQNVTDADGRVTSQSKATTRSLTWTSFDGVRTITDNGVTATYIYDAFGQIVRTDVDAATDSSITLALYEPLCPTSNSRRADPTSSNPSASTNTTPTASRASPCVTLRHLA
ncbi:MAG TPA: hypothetical protein PLW14_08165 [Chlorobiota bacterium]|nr:hypothetical protein [Chlorobiota bacterium]